MNSHPLEIAVLGLECLDDIVLLHRTVLNSLPDHSFLYPHEPSYFESVIASEGVIVGARVRGRLAAYAAIILPRATGCAGPTGWTTSTSTSLLLHLARDVVFIPNIDASASSGG